MDSLSRMIFRLQSLQYHMRWIADEMDLYFDEIGAQPLTYPAELRDAADLIKSWIAGLRHQEIA